MKKKIYKFFLLFLVILISIFSGYENPNLVEVPKKYARFIIKKMGIKDSFFNKKIENIDPDKNEKKEGCVMNQDYVSTMGRLFIGKKSNLLELGGATRGYEIAAFGMKKNTFQKLKRRLYGLCNVRHVA